MTIQMNIKNELGDFYSEKMQVTSEQYMELVEVSKKFYIEEAGFEMWLENGFMVMSSDMARRSILSINILEYDKEEDDKQTNNENKI